MRTITSDSHCPIQHKQSAFHSAIHRLCRLPLSISNYKKEHEYIKEMARVNGYNPDLIDKLVKKHSQKVTRSNLTTLFTQNEAEHTDVGIIHVLENYTKKYTKYYSNCIIIKSITQIIQVLK